MKRFDYMQPQPIVGENAKALRQRCGITQEEFAEKIGTSRQTIINFETGKTQSMALLQAYLRLAKGEI